jgi:hypothetical protein
MQECDKIGDKKEQLIGKLNTICKPSVQSGLELLQEV